MAEPPQRRHHPRRAAVRDGFSLHADTAVHGHDRQGLERLCRSGARGAVAESRLRRLEGGRYEYSPKAPPSPSPPQHGCAGSSRCSRPRGFTSPRSTAATPPTPACGPSSPNRSRHRSQRRCPARHRRRRFQRQRNRSGPASTGPSFISAPSAPTCCAAPAAEGATAAMAGGDCHSGTRRTARAGT